MHTFLRCFSNAVLISYELNTNILFFQDESSTSPGPRDIALNRHFVPSDDAGSTGEYRINSSSGIRKGSVKQAISKIESESSNHFLNEVLYIQLHEEHTFYRLGLQEYIHI